MRNSIIIMTVMTVLAGGVFVLTGADKVIFKPGEVTIGNNPEPQTTQIDVDESPGAIIVTEPQGSVTIQPIQEQNVKKESDIDVNIVYPGERYTEFTISNSQGGIAYVDGISLIVKNMTKGEECFEQDIPKYLPSEGLPHALISYDLGTISIQNDQNQYPIIEKKDRKYETSDGIPTSFYYDEGSIDEFLIFHKLDKSILEKNPHNYLYYDKIQKQFFFSNPEKIFDVYFNDETSRYEYGEPYGTVKENEVTFGESTVIELNPRYEKIFAHFTGSYYYEIAIKVDWCDPTHCEDKKTTQTDFYKIERYGACPIKIDFNQDIVQSADFW